MSEYDELIDLEHPEPKLHARMPRAARAAQFAPFAALTGYDGALAERRRTTEAERYLDETRIEELNRSLSYVVEHPHLGVCVRFFAPDERKSGGSYQSALGHIKRVDAVEGLLIFRDGKKIPIKNIMNIEVYENESTQ